VSRDIQVTIYPIYTSVDINLEKAIFKPETEIIIPCSIKVNIENFWIEVTKRNKKPIIPKEHTTVRSKKTKIQVIF